MREHERGLLQACVQSLERVEQLTAGTQEELMALASQEQILRDAEAGTLFNGVITEIMRTSARGHVLAALRDNLQAGLSGLAAELGMQVPELFIACANPKEQRIKVAGMRCIHVQGGIARRALQQLLAADKN